MVIYQTRWSAKRLHEIANTIKGKKRDVISKSSFGDLVHISPLGPPPEELVDFIVMRIDTKKRLLKLNDRKAIHFTRDMVKKIFNVPSGSKPLEFGKRGKADFREVYLDGERAPIPTTVAVLSNADDGDAETIDRSWILLCLALVLAPGTGNMVPLEYLYTLRDMSVVHEFEWDEHILFDVMREVQKYQDRRNGGKLKFLIGGCLPMLPLIYMDHIDIPRGCIVDHTIDYSLPRACFVQDLDFTAVVAVDTLEDGFGKRHFSSITPYTTTKFLPYVDQLAQSSNQASVTEKPPELNDQGGAGASATQIPNVDGADGTEGNVHEPPPDNTVGSDDVCGSLEEWLHPLPTFEELELPPHMRAIYNKHKDIHATDLKGALSSFGRLLEGMYCKRMALMLSEASKAGSRSAEAKYEGPDVTFDVPAAPVDGMCDASTSGSSPQQQKHPDCATETTNATETVSSPQQPKEPDGMKQVTTATTNATKTVSSPQQPKQPDGAKSVDPAVVVGETNAAQPANKSESEHNNGIDNSNAKGEDLCSKVKSSEQMSPRSTFYPCVNLIRSPRTLEDGPSFGLFEPGSPEALLFQDPVQVESPPRSPAVDVDSFLEIRARSPLFDDNSPAASAGPVYDVTPLATCPPKSTVPAEACVDETREEVVVEVSSGRGPNKKKPPLKRAAPTEQITAKLPKMKKIKIDATDDAIYQRYCCTNYRIKDPPRGEPLPSFIRIGGFDISFKHFSNGLRKRAHVNNEVMSLYIESFNIEHMYSSTKPRKFAFSPHVASKLCVDPTSFKTSSCIRDLTRACEKNDIVKFDQLFFTIVHQDHWAVVVLNFMLKQFNVFDSNREDPDYVSNLDKPYRNLIENFKTLVRERNPWKHDLDTFECLSPSGYPRQSTTYDCGIFAILYMENLTAKGLKSFATDSNSLLNYRKYLAAKLFKHPQNTLSSEDELQALLKKSKIQVNCRPQQDIASSLGLLFFWCMCVRAVL